MTVNDAAEHAEQLRDWIMPISILAAVSVAVLIHAMEVQHPNRWHWLAVLLCVASAAVFLVDLFIILGNLEYLRADYSGSLAKLTHAEFWRKTRGIYMLGMFGACLSAASIALMVFAKNRTVGVLSALIMILGAFAVEREVLPISFVGETLDAILSE